jgi:hypothetical protein
VQGNHHRVLLLLLLLLAVVVVGFVSEVEVDVVTLLLLLLLGSCQVATCRGLLSGSISISSSRSRSDVCGSSREGVGLEASLTHTLLISLHPYVSFLHVLHVDITTLLLLLVALLLGVVVSSSSDVHSGRRCRHCCRSVIGPQYVGARRPDGRGGQVLLTQPGGCVGRRRDGCQRRPWVLLLLLLGLAARHEGLHRGAVVHELRNSLRGECPLQGRLQALEQLVSRRVQQPPLLLAAAAAGRRLGHGGGCVGQGIGDAVAEPCEDRGQGSVDCCTHCCLQHVCDVACRHGELLGRHAGAVVAAATQHRVTRVTPLLLLLGSSGSSSSSSSSAGADGAVVTAGPYQCATCQPAAPMGTPLLLLLLLGGCLCPPVL